MLATSDTTRASDDRDVGAGRLERSSNEEAVEVASLDPGSGALTTDGVWGRCIAATADKGMSLVDAYSSRNLHETFTR